MEMKVSRLAASSPLALRKLLVSGTCLRSSTEATPRGAASRKGRRQPQALGDAARNPCVSRRSRCVFGRFRPRNPSKGHVAPRFPPFSEAPSRGASWASRGSRCTSSDTRFASKKAKDPHKKRRVCHAFGPSGHLLEGSRPRKRMPPGRR